MCCHQKPRIFVLSLFVLLCCLGSVSADYDAVSNVHLNVKYGTTSTAAVQTAFEAEIGRQATAAAHTVSTIAWASFPTDFTADGTATCTITYSDWQTETETVSYTVVSPTGYAFATTLSSLSSTSSYNSSNAALLSYVNSQLTLTATGNVFQTAVGTAPIYTAASFSWSNSNTAYVAMGATYTFTQTYNGFPVSRTLTVSQSLTSAPDVDIDYSSCNVSTTTDMSYSIDAGKWTACTANMMIPTTWYGKYVYFYYPANAYHASSNSLCLYIPTKANAPSESLSLTATSYSITINNCWDFDNCEYSVNGTTWSTTTKETLTFNGLSAKTSYTVYVRTKAQSGEYFASTNKSASITTKAAVVNNVDVKYSVSDNVGYADAVASIAPSVTSYTMNGSLKDLDLTTFKSIINTYVKDRSSVESTLVINHYTEDTDQTDVKTINFSLPMAAIKEAIMSGNLEATYHCDFLSIDLSNANLLYLKNKSTYGTLYISTAKISTLNGSKFDWVKNQIANDRPVYKLSVSVGSSSSSTSSAGTAVTYNIPYTLQTGELASNIEVYFVNASSGISTLIDSNYTLASSTVTFSSDAAGYFVISNTGTGKAMSFTDVPSSHWARTYINFCYQQGLIAGVSATQYNTTSPVTRAMVMTLLANLAGADTSTAPTSTAFTDIKVTDWYAASANWAKTQGLVTGTTFNPNGAMTRAEIASTIYTFMGKQGQKLTTSKDLAYTDAKKLPTAVKKAIYYVNSAGIMGGTSTTTFNPTGSVTRAQMATILYRLYDILD